MPRVSEAHKEQRRQAILDAALNVFIGKGYQVATINDISARCGLSVGAIYRYFRNKSEIMLTLVAERLGRTPELLARLTEQEPGPWERLVRSVEIFAFALRLRHPSTGRLLLVTLAEAVGDADVRRGLQDRFGALRAFLAGIIREGMTAGIFRPDVDPEALAVLLLCTADGLAVYWVTGTPGVDLRSLRNTLLAMLHPYLVENRSTKE